MKKRSRLQQFVFSATIVASPIFGPQCGITWATDGPTLKPANAEQPLHQIPSPDTISTSVAAATFTQDGKSPSGSSTVRAELQKIFQQNGQQMPAMSAAYSPRLETPDIKRVQHTEQAAQTETNRRPPRRDNGEKKTGLFKRLFAKIAGEPSEPVRPVGEPAPPIPTPPPIVYNTQQQTSVLKNDGSIRARAAGYEKRQPQTALPTQAGDNTQTNVQYFPSGTTSSASLASHRKPVVESDGFINPFQTQTRTPEDEALLDLDSLIENGEPAVKPPIDARLTPLDYQAPQISKNSNNEAVLPDKTMNEGPYTGFQLDSDRQLYGSPKASPVIKRVQQSPTEPGDRSESASEPEFEEIPLLDEAVVELPSTAPTPSSEDVAPLLPKKEAFKSQDDKDNSAEPLVAIPPEDTQPEQLPEQIEQTSESRDVQPAMTDTENIDAEKLKSLEVRAQRNQQIYRIMARTGQKGFKGFCPVELRDNRQLINSNAQFKAKFGLQTYHFSSQEAKSAFDANPARYAPAAGGSDVVLLVNTGEEEAGTLEFTLWYRDRLYMFRSRETVEIFAKDPVRYANQY